MVAVSYKLPEPVFEEALSRLMQALAPAEVAGELAGVLESQTRERFETKEAPDGTPWSEWSEAYAQTRHGGHSRLMNEGDLEDSITGYSDATGAEVGSPLVYAAIHQFSGAEIGKPGLPARPYLGLSSDNERQLIAAVSRLAEDAIHGR